MQKREHQKDMDRKMQSNLDKFNAMAAPGRVQRNAPGGHSAQRGAPGVPLAGNARNDPRMNRNIQQSRDNAKVITIYLASFDLFDFTFSSQCCRTNGRVRLCKMTLGDAATAAISPRSPLSMERAFARSRGGCGLISACIVTHASLQAVSLKLEPQLEKQKKSSCNCRSLWRGPTLRPIGGEHEQPFKCCCGCCCVSKHRCQSARMHYDKRNI